jgi:hypothetical protein
MDYSGIVFHCAYKKPTVEEIKQWHKDNPFPRYEMCVKWNGFVLKNLDFS